MSHCKTIKILVLSASSTHTGNSHLDVEICGIKDELERAQCCDRFEFIPVEVVRVDDLSRPLLKHKPDIVYFAGCGIGEQGLVLEDDNGKAQIVSPQALCKLFGWRGNTVKCVFLSSCYLKAQAEAIHQSIDCVIGTNRAIGDRVAIKFAAKFYEALVSGESFQSAYEYACTALNSSDDQELSLSELLSRVEGDDPLAIAASALHQHQLATAIEVQTPSTQATQATSEDMTNEADHSFATTQATDNAHVYQTNAHHAFNMSGGVISGQVDFAGRDLIKTIHHNTHNVFGFKTYSQLKLLTVLGFSSGIAVVVIIARFFGLLQPLELWFYDRLLQSQAELSSVDKRFLVVGITKEDYVWQKEQEKAGQGKLVGSISNENLTQLLKKLDDFNPVAIGLDLYREEPIDEKQYPDLLNRFKTQSNLFTVCKASDSSDPNSSEVAPPVGFPSERVGFSDFAPLDKDGWVLRRHLLAFKPDESSLCQADVSFNLRLANFFLKNQKSIEFDSKQLFTPEGYCQDLQFTNGLVFPNVQPYTGGYQGYSSNDDLTAASYLGCQVLLKYRNSRIDDTERHSFAKRGMENVSLKEILAEDFPVDKYQGRIILIGVVRSDGGNDYWSTPLANEQIPGVMIQSQMISQIIDAASAQSALIWVFPQWAEVLFILGASLAGGISGYLTSSNRYLIACIGSILFLWVAGCFIVFQFFSGWLPCIPTVLVLFGSAAVVGIPRLYKVDKSLQSSSTVSSTSSN
jgi:CHASE2 domain-containing sensor protein